MVLAAFMALVLVPTAGATPSPLATTLKVPSQYPTIQKAINAAHSGDTILVAPGTYVEQLTIHKSVTIIGSGAGQTIIKSPAGLAPDPFGNPWTIEIDNGATVTVSGFTLLVTLQCIHSSGLPADLSVHPHIPVYAGGGIGVGGSAVLNLASAVVTTTGATEGASCGATSFMSYGTGVDFGLDYVTGSPAASKLLGSGTVSGVTISGFGFGGPSVSVGGQANSPAGSSAVISKDRITTSADDSGVNAFPFVASGAPTISVGFGGNASSATIIGNILSTLPSLLIDNIEVFFGSSAYIALNSILVGPEIDAVLVLSSSATITLNSIAGSTTDFSGGIILQLSSATVTLNLMSNFECGFNASVVAAGLCGPSDLTQAQVVAIGAIGDVGPGTVIENNLITNADVGIVLAEGCSSCVVKGNIIINSPDYALDGTDGNYSFLQNLVIGGSYGVAAIAFSANTTVTLTHVVILNPSVGKFYLENDCLAVFGYTCTDTIIGT
jgi:parallel beta-helix repeat protein